MTFSTKTLSLAAILAATVSGAAIADGNGVGVGANGGASVSVGAGGNGNGVGGDMSADAGVKAGAGVETAPGQNKSADMNVTGGGNTEMAADAGASDEWNYGRVVSSIRTGTFADVDLSSVGDDAEFDIMALSGLKGEAAGNAQALDNALADNSATVDDLQAKVDANTDLAAKIEEEGYSTEDVVAIYTKADGSYEVLIDDRS